MRRLLSRFRPLAAALALWALLAPTLALAALPTIKVDSTNGAASDTTASGAGPTTALSGTNNASTDAVNGQTVTLPAGTDLSGVLTDGSHVIFFNDSTAGNKNFAPITGTVGSGGATPQVTLPAASALGINVTNKSWAIGGTRATIAGTNSKKLFDNNSASGDAMPGWIVEMKSGHVETIAATLSARRSGDATNGPIWLRGASGAATPPKLTFSNNGTMLQASGTNLWFSDFDLNNSAATRTSSIALTPQINCKFQRIRVRDASPFNVGKAYSGAVGNGTTVDSCDFGNCLSHAIATTAGGRFTFNYLHDNAGNGIDISGANSGSYIVGNILARNAIGISNAQTGTTAAGGYIIRLNTIHGNTGDGIVFTANGTTNTTPFIGLILENNLITGNGGWGINFSGSPTQASLDGNNTLIRGNNGGAGGTANTSGFSSLASAIADATNIAVDPGYTNAAGNNFAVTASGAQGKGYPTGATVGGGSSTTSYDTAGAAQPNPSGGSGGIKVSPLKGGPIK